MKHIVLLTILALGSGQVWASGVGVRAGTDGVGADIAFSDAIPFPGASLRVGVSKLDFNKSVSETGVAYDGKLKLNNGSVLVDWAPIGPFRVTGGLMFGTNKISLNGTPTGGNYQFGNHTYTASQIGSIAGEVKASRSVSPYVGVGYGTVAGMGVNFYTDFGVMFTGGAKASVNVNCGASVSAATCSQIQADAASEQQKLQDKVNFLKSYPIARIGFTIGF
ncbi:hypothetical protein KSF73_02810 [Burkholderiaceae bacterium DAT-1]|nr:hypothetical protein [Burkholderiaceae bacterium DAT-1]